MISVCSSEWRFFFFPYKLGQVRNLSFLGKTKYTSLAFTEEQFWYNLSCFTPSISVVLMLNTYSVVCSSCTHMKFSKMWICVWTKILFILKKAVGSRRHSWFYPEFSLVAFRECDIYYFSNICLSFFSSKSITLFGSEGTYFQLITWC